MKRKILTLFTALVMTVAMSVTAFAADTVTINVSDPPQVGVINTLLEKANSEPSTYPLSGAVFEVKHYPNVTGATTGTPIHTWYFQTTDLGSGKYGINGSSPTLASGYTSSALIPYGSYAHVWPLGTYTIQEVKPPAEYLIEEESVTFTVKYNANGGQYDAVVDGPSIPGSSNTTLFKNEGVTLTEQNIWANISAIKKDKDNDEALPEGNASLAGIKFALVLRSQAEYCLKNDINRLVQKGEVVEILTTDDKGAFTSLKNNLRYGTYELVELRSDSTIAVGDIYDSSESKYGSSIYANDESYLFDSQKETKDVHNDGEVVEFTFSNTVVRGGIHVTKKDVEVTNVQGDATLAGIKFAIVNRSTNKVKVDGTNRQPGQVVKIITTDANGEAKTTNETLPYGSYSIHELREDSTIAVGDAYDSSTAKYGKSIYANPTGINGANDSNHGSMLFDAYTENFDITYQHEMVGEGTKLSETGSNETFTDNRAHPKNRVVRGGFEAYKVDKETMISYPLEGASLSGIEFTLKNASKTSVFVTNAKYPSGHLYAPGEVIHNPEGKDVWTTDSKGWIGSSNQYLPYGTYTLQETKTNDSYHLTDGNPHTFEVRIEKQVTCKDEDSILKTKAEAQALINKWVGRASGNEFYAKGNLVFPDQVKRGPFRFQKKNENGELMKNIPWKITNTTTGEVHYVMTDANGEFFTDKVNHSVNTNKWDEYFASYGESGDKVPTSLTEQAAEETRYNVGMWFSLSKDLSTHAPVDDNLGTFPYGWYTLEELRCDANEGKELIKDAFYIYSDDGADLGTLDNEPVDVKTQAKDNKTKTDIGKISENDEIIDHIEFYGLYTGRKYKVVSELHYAVGEEGHKTDGGIITDNQGNPVRVETNPYTPTTRDSTKTVYLSLDSRKLYADGEELKGPDAVIFEYVYEIKDDGSEILTKAHIDPNDRDQTIYYPWIGTTLTDDDTNIRMGFARKNMSITDRIEYRNFVPEYNYTFKGVLIDKETGQPALDSDGNEITAEKTVYLRDKNGVVDLTYKFNGEGMQGQTLVAYENVSSSLITITHEELDDESQNFHIPKIGTKAKDKDTTDDVGKVVGTFVDTITYENLIPGYTYKMSGELMFKDSNTSSGQKGSKEFTAVAIPTDANRSDGSITVEIPLTLTKAQLEGKSLVAFEELIVLPNQDDTIVKEDWLKNLPKKEKVIAEHKDIDDTAQTVNYPKIRTLAVDSKTQDHVGTVETNARVIDTVEYWNLVPGKQYTIRGKLLDADTGTVLATANDVTFTASTDDAVTGKKELQFSISSANLDGHTVVVYEKLFHNNVEVTQHEEKTDETQRVHYPWMNTTAIDSETRDHVGTILGKLKNVFRRLTGEDVADTVYQKVIDKVDYKNTIPSETYVISGTLMNKESGEAILGDDGNPITSSATLKAGLHAADGSVDITFSVDSSKLENVTIVCYEKMLHQNPVTKEDIEVNRHENLSDENQSVHDVEIHTTAIDEHTADHVGDTTGNTVINDKVEMKNLVSGMKYTLKGTLYDKDSGEPIVDRNGEKYTAETTFTAQGNDGDKRVDKTEHLKFNVDGTLLEDHTVVVFEDLYHNDVRITTHSDLNDEEQSVHYPKVGTIAKDSKTKDHVGTVGSNETVIDTVELKNLIPGQVYTVKGKLMKFGTTEPLLDKNNNEITDSKTITADAEDMVIELSFAVDSTIYRNVTTVAFEKLYHPNAETGEDVNVANHEEPNDEGQSVHYPNIRTHAIDSKTGGHVGTIAKSIKVRDKVALENLIPEMEYTIKGVLRFQSDVKDLDGNVVHHKGDIVQYNGKDVTATTSFTADKANDERVLEFTLDSSVLESATVVAFEKLYHPENNTGTLVEVVQHEDLTDEEQSVHYPRVGTIASDGLTADHVGATEQNTITDTVKYENLIIGQLYRLKGTVMDKKTGKAIEINGKTVTADTGWFTADKTDGTKDITFDIDASELDGETVVVFEKLFTPEETEWTDIDKNPIVEIEVTNHEDINDEDQSVHYPKVSTQARDADTDDHVGTVKDGAQVKDTVTLENLIKGQKYTVKGTLMKFGTTQPVLDSNGNKVTAEKSFTADAENMTIELDFSKYDSSVVRGETTVCFEYLYHPNANTGVDVEVATHEVPDEEVQSVHYPKIKTTAIDSRTGDHVGTVLGKLINGFRRVMGQDVSDTEIASVIDTVSYQNLIPGQKYTISGTLMNKESGNAILGDDGKAITASVDVTPSEANGSVKLTFPVDTSKLENVTIVCFEKLYHNNVNTNESVEVDRHEDLNDEEQSVHEAKIRTHAVDKHVALDDAHNDWHTGDATGKTIVDDAVTLDNLVNGMTYTLTGTLHYKDNGKAVLDGAGAPYKTTITFTVNEQTEAKRVNLVKHIQFEVDGKALEGRTVVAFEQLYHNDVEITVHADINDEEQSVYYPWIRTLAVNNKNGAKEIQITENTEIKDTVTYKNLLPGKYVLEGVLMDKTTGESVKDAEGKPITQKNEFTITSANEGKKGTKELVFSFDSTKLADHIVVAYEKLYILDENNEDYKVEIAKHEDLNDTEQSIWIIDIGTHLTDVMDNSDEGEEREEAEWQDRVSYKGLIIDKEYTMKGVLMDKATGKEFKDANGKTVTAEAKFTPKTSCGFVDLTFKANTVGLAGKTVVAFEELYPSDLPDTVIAEHKDITDEEQSVNIIKIRTHATDKETNINEGMASKESTIIDRVTYTNLVVGREYTLKAKLMDKKTGQPILINGAEVTQTVKFTPESAKKADDTTLVDGTVTDAKKPMETVDGYVDVVFTLDTSAIAGETMVAYERLFNVEDVMIAHHEDINDEEQSVHIPSVITVAELENENVLDDVTYKNLVPGQYIARGWLVDKETGRKLKESDGEAMFTLTEYATEGTITVELPVTGYEKLGGYELTAFEEIYLVTKDENGNPIEKLVAEHKDIEDEAQTVEIPKTPKTGETPYTILYGSVLILSAALVYIMRRKRELSR